MKPPRQRRFVLLALLAVLGATLFIGFHMLTLGGQPMAVVLTSVAGNGLAGLVFGWLYARFGYEYLILSHFVAHVLAVGFASPSRNPPRRMKS